MSISYNKDVRVVFLVQEGLGKVREATEEDFLRAGYVPASGRGNVDAPEVAATTDKEAGEDYCDSASCEGCAFGEEIYLIDFVGGKLGDVFKDTIMASRLDKLKDTVGAALDPLLFFVEDVKVEAEKPAMKEKVAPVEGFAGDLFKGAFNVFNTVKSGLADLLEPVEYPEPAKPDAKESAPVTPEPVKEETTAEEKPEFNEFEQTVIGKFEEMGLGADAKSAMRKSKEFAEFLSSKSPTPEQAKAFAEMLKNGKPPFFG